jgi:low temperature requirement protein LtrA
LPSRASSIGLRPYLTRSRHSGFEPAISSNALWWLYFNGDEKRAEAALSETSLERAPWLALNAFGYAFVPILGGIVLVAASLRLAVVIYHEPSTTSAAVFLAGGVAAYLVGLAIFRWLVHVQPVTVRLIMAALAVVTILIGLRLSATAQLAALVLILVGGNIAEQLVSRPR